MLAKAKTARGLASWWPALPALLLAGSAYGEANPDVFGWLQKIQNAAQTVSYTGLLVYQQGQQMQTSRIVHFADATGEHEKLETLDGVRKEFIRDNDEVKCFMPDIKTVTVERRGAARPFPGLLTAQVGSIGEVYSMRLMAKDRVAGVICQVLVLEPRDNLRYGHRFCVDPRSGLLLRAQTLNHRNELVEQIAFTQVTIGAPIDRQALKPRFATVNSEWRVENAGATPANLADAGWALNGLPPGFKKVMELLRTRSGQSEAVGQMVLSDGMAAVSIFFGPLRAESAQETSRLSQQGAINVYSLQVEGHTITVLGDAPVDSVMQIGNAVQFRKP